MILGAWPNADYSTVNPIPPKTKAPKAVKRRRSTHLLGWSIVGIATKRAVVMIDFYKCSKRQQRQQTAGSKSVAVNMPGEIEP